MPSLPSPPLLLLLSIVLYCLHNLPTTHSYRVHPDTESSTPFTPYESGFVGVQNEPSNYLRERTNEGAPGTQTYPRQFGGQDGDNRGKQICPGMVGPLSDKKYYCLAKEFGYCDRRSGSCFCNVGYEGSDCGNCSPTHVREGGLCYPKKLCPQDCSGSGVCDYLTGTCTCREHRSGSDCSTKLCTQWDVKCNECDDGGCLKCTEGYAVNRDLPALYQCRSCTIHDPRCSVCTVDSCLSCSDPLLTSIRRSGARPTDIALPQDELDRELSILVPFGSLQVNAFDEAEPFYLQKTGPDLYSVAEACDQGFDTNRDWNCSTTVISHKVCGHNGTFSFSSPEYALNEGGGSVRITVRRSGGGANAASVDYNLEHITTNDTHVTATHIYTTSQTLDFEVGQISKSFLVTIHDDRIYTGDKMFLLSLTNPTNGAMLGPSRRTTVTILDDDLQRTVPRMTNTVQSSSPLEYTKWSADWNVAGAPELTGSTESNIYWHTRAFAGEANTFTVEARKGNGMAQNTGGDTMLLEVTEKKYRAGYSTSAEKGDKLVYDYNSLSRSGKVHGHRMNTVKAVQEVAADNGDGTYDASITVERAGNYEMHAMLVVPGGFLGHYYDDPYMTPEHLTKRRVDAQLNFDWETGSVTTFGKDFASVWWGGKIKVASSDVYTFSLEFDDNARLYIDGSLLIDEWDRSPGLSSTSFSLVAGVYHDVMVEFRDVLGTAHLKLYWESAGAGVPYSLVPSENMYYTEEFMGSPYNYTVVAAAADGPKTTARGLGLYKATAGFENKFSIESRDSFGNWRGDFDTGFGSNAAFFDKFLGDVAKLDGFVGVASLVSDSSGGGRGGDDVPVDIKWNEATRLFDCTYVPGRSGVYSLAVGLSSELLPYFDENPSSLPQIFGSPFTVDVTPGPTFSRESEAYGGFGNCAADSGSPIWDVTGALADVWGSWDAGDGCSGVNHGVAGDEQWFYINSRDAQNNNRSAWGDNWSVVAHSHDSLLAFEGTVEEDTFRPGIYIAKITPLTSGRYYLDVTLDGAHAEGSPFELYVRHNVAYGPTSVIVGEATGAHLNAETAPTVNSFIVQPRDKEGNDLKRDSYPYVSTVSAYVTSDASNSVTDATGTINWLGDGTFRVDYTPTVSGENKLNVVINGGHINGSPFTITSQAWLGSVRGSTSTATGAGLTSGTAGIQGTFVLQARDVNGNPRTGEGDTFTVDLAMNTLSVRPADLDNMVDDNWGNAAAVLGSCSYFEDGKYNCIYNATVSGTYDMSVVEQAGAEHIVNSPFNLVISPAVASATESDVPGVGTRSGTAGDSNVVEVYTRDVFGNYLLTGGDHVSVTATLRSHHQSQWERRGATDSVVNGIDAGAITGEVEDVYKTSVPVTDMNNGRYMAHFTPPYSGTYDLTGYIETPGGLWGYYYTTDDWIESKMSLLRHDLTVDFDWDNYSPVSGGQAPGVSCLTSGTTGVADDPNTITWDESKCYGTGLSLPADFFSVKWTGFIEAEHDEEYEFGMLCDEKSHVSLSVAGVDLVPLSHCSGNGGMLTGKLVMKAGVRVPIEVKYKHADLVSTIGMKWRSETQGAWAVIGKDRLYRNVIASATVYVPVYAPNVPSAPHSTAVGAVVTNSIAGMWHNFTVECRDGFAGGASGNLQLVGGGCNVAVLGRAASGAGIMSTFEGSVWDNGDGTYNVTYYAESSGTYYLSVTAETAAAHDDYGSHIRDWSVQHAHVAGSPFVLNVVAGASTEESEIDVLAVEDAVVGVESNVTIWARDNVRNRILTGGEVFEIFLAEGGVGDTYGHVDGDKNVYGTVVDNGDGTYTGLFVPAEQSGPLGTWELHVKLRVFDESGGVVSRLQCGGNPYDIVIWPSDPVGATTHVASGESGKVLVVAAPGGEINTFSTNVNSLRTFYVQASDVSGNKWWVGGSNLVARVRGSTNEVKENTRLLVTDIGDGTYKVDMTLTQAGAFEIDVGIAGSPSGLSKYGSGVVVDTGGFGLLGRYFSNQHMLGAPSIVRVDSTVDFNWGHGLITDSAIDYVSVEWTGYVKMPSSEDVVFELANVDDYARLSLDGDIVLDTREGETEFVFSNGKANMLYEIKVEFFEKDLHASIGLYWRSDSMERHLVPSKWLYSSLDLIQGSPFALTVV
ncbi:hypothetical protein TrLO_g8091 [Triparma laevis f. longispina]|uniref:PA14 domain-containing protein n=1 Tax=Triparma laevis f. longispina TaxID=1714387 RepID=A0A9W7E0X8_9STRA|nr:hypothetical protein TrLO_g8091 [Triparma laevis f. longispina]